jgi:hypothetical protein
LSRPQEHRIEVHAPRGVDVASALWEDSVVPRSGGQFPLRLRAAPDLEPGVYIVAFDVTLDGKRYGSWFDMLTCVE